MDIKFAKDNIKDLDKARIKALKEYQELQPKFTKLAKTWVARHFMINYVNEELDVDGLSDEQCKRLDNCKDKDSRAKMIKDLPQAEVPYPFLYITPYGIWDEINKQDLTVDELATDMIEEINLRVKSRIELYAKLK